MSFKVVLIGCGWMAGDGHGPALARYAQAHPDVELAACCDVDAPKAAEFAQRFGFARHFADVTGMLDAVRPDAVSLVVPTALTCRLTCQLFERRIPTILEKPPGENLDELRRMIRAADAHGVPHQVAFNRRHCPVFRELKKQLTAAPSALQHLRYTMTRVKRLDEDFTHTSIHAVDAVRYLAGSPYRRLRFRYQPLTHLGPAVANMFFDGEFASGVTVHLAVCPVTGVVTERAEAYAQDDAWFAHLGVQLEGPDYSGGLRHFMSGKLVAAASGTELAGGAERFLTHGFYGENEAFLDAIRAGQRPVDDLRSCVQSVVVAEALRRRQEECVPAEE
jgi:myo-inositol 2-dehydrogenase/D-chiro-inositol 1-dehydrogenase